eukprot:gene2706-3361_t
MDMDACGSLMVVGTNCTYECLEGHYLEQGDLDRTCLLNGSLSGQAPGCKAYQCDTSPPHGCKTCELVPAVEDQCTECYSGYDLVPVDKTSKTCRPFNCTEGPLEYECRTCLPQLRLTANNQCQECHIGAVLVDGFCVQESHLYSVNLYGCTESDIEPLLSPLGAHVIFKVTLTGMRGQTRGIMDNSVQQLVADQGPSGLSQAMYDAGIQCYLQNEDAGLDLGFNIGGFPYNCTPGGLSGCEECISVFFLERNDQCISCTNGNELQDGSHLCRGGQAALYVTNENLLIEEDSGTYANSTPIVMLSNVTIYNSQEVQYNLLSWEGGDFDIEPIINSSTGVLMFKAAPDFFSPPGHPTVVTAQARVINAEELTTFTETNTVTFKYDAQSACMSFIVVGPSLCDSCITFANVNDAPTFNVTTVDSSVFKAGNTSYLVGLPTDVLSISVPFATGISAGNAYEVNQTVLFVCNATNTGIFAQQPEIDSTGALRLALADFGDATVTCSLRDNGGTENGGNDTSASITIMIQTTQGIAEQTKDLWWIFPLIIVCCCCCCCSLLLALLAAFLARKYWKRDKEPADLTSLQDPPPGAQAQGPTEMEQPLLEPDETEVYRMYGEPFSETAGTLNPNDPYAPNQHIPPPGQQLAFMPVQ